MYKLPSLQELLEAGVHFGHQVRRGHPRMKTFIFGSREGIHVIDLTKSETYLKEAAEAAYELGKNGKILLFVGTKKQARPIVEELAKKLDTPYLVERWVGGFLTNFDEILKNIKVLKTLKEQKEKNQLTKYTKKERLLIDRKIAKLEKDYKGVMNYDRTPDALFVVDAVSDNVAVKEAKRSRLKVIAIADSNCNVEEIDYPIPGNDDAIKSIKILTEAIGEAYWVGKQEAGKNAEKAAKQAEEDQKKALEKVSEEIVQEVAEAEEKVEKASVADSGRKV